MIQTQEAVPTTAPRMILALDLDGTLLTSDETVSSGNRAALQKAVENGILPTIVTGRIAHNKVQTLVRELDIGLPFATLNGGAILAPSGELMHVFPIPPEHVRWLFQLADADGLDYWVCTLERVVHKADLTASDVDQVINATFRAETPEVMARFRQQVEEANRYNLTWPDDSHIVANAKGVNKATALEIICAKYGLSAQNAAAVGDGINDFEMLAWTEYSFAMGNAIKALKGVARETTLDCNDDGVAIAVSRLLELLALTT